MWKDRLKDEWNNNPMAVIAAGTAAGSFLVKVIATVSEAQGRRAYAKQVNHKIKTKK